MKRVTALASGGARGPVLRTTRRVLAVALLALGAAQATSAQCFVPDGLSGPCWQPVNLNLPQLTGFNLPGKGLCWKTCVSQEDCIRVVLGTPIPTAICGEFRSTVEVLDCNGQPFLLGTAILNYTRNWEESAVLPPGPANFEVWRFLVKVDFGPAVPNVAPCLLPTCLPATPSAFYYGYADWARNCQTGAFQNVLVLFHNCDFFIHKPGVSSRPGAFHPDTSYALVAPSTPANDFKPADLSHFAGPFTTEAVRNVTNPAGLPFCTAEERIDNGALDHFVDLCFCASLDLTSTHNTLSKFSGLGTCPDPTGLPSFFLSLNTFFPTLPWYEMLSTSIGRWDNDSSYPGREQVWVDEGLFFYHDSCPIAVPAMGGIPDSLEVMYGASTQDGYPIVQTVPGTQPSTRLLDLGDNFTLELGGPPPPPFFLGSILGPTDHLIYVDVP